MASSGTNRFWIGKAIKEDTSEETLLGTSSTENLFAVTQYGKLICKNADIQGTLYAEKGRIGGWTIEKNRLVGRDSDTAGTITVGLDSTARDSKNPNTYFAIWTGASSPGTYNLTGATPKLRL
ncbi:MAG: hypothetical protein NC548_25650 [Lachnospiraceae bacterium]|nr:hypothetical protein [Lachnospiraceae bacterium]